MKNLSRDGRADEIANEIVSTFDLILIRFGTFMSLLYGICVRISADLQVIISVIIILSQ